VSGAALANAVSAAAAEVAAASLPLLLLLLLLLLLRLLRLLLLLYSSRWFGLGRKKPDPTTNKHNIDSTRVLCYLTGTKQNSVCCLGGGWGGLLLLLEIWMLRLSASKIRSFPIL